MNLSGDLTDTNEGDLLAIKKKQREWSSPSLTQSEKVRKTREAFEKMHQAGDDDDDLYDFGKVPKEDGDAARQFTPPPMPISIGTQQKIGTEQQQIMASKMHNAQMGYQTAPRPSLSGSAFNLVGNNETTPLTLSAVPPPASSVQFSPIMPNTNSNSHKMLLDSSRDIGAGIKDKEGFAMPYLGASSLAAPVPNRGSTADTDLYKIHHTPTWQPNTMLPPTDDLLLKKLNYMIHLLEEQKDDKTGNATEEILLYSFLGVFMIFLVDSFTRVGKYVR